MKDQAKTKEQLIDELAGLRRQVAELEAVETERKQAEEALRDALAELTVIQQNVPIAMMLVDCDRRVHKVNEAASLFAGRPGEEMLGLRSGEALRCLHHLDNPQGCGFGPACATCAVRLAVLDTFASHESKRDVEAWLPFPQGDAVEERCLLISTAYLQMDDAERVLVCAQDITDHKRAEEAVREGGTRYQAIVEAFDGLIYICSQDYRVEFMNERLIERTGYDGTGELCYKVLHDLDTICPWCANDRVFTGETTRWEIQSPKDDRWYYVVNAPIYHTDGSMSKQAMILDITERKQAEEALRASEERLQLALDAAQMGQWEWNIVTGEVVWSQQCLALYGLPPDTPMSYERFLQALHPEDREHIDAALRRAVENRTSYDESKRTIWTDGSIHWTASRGQVYCDATGQPSRMIGVTFDVTKAKEAEEALRQSEERFRALYEDNPSMYFMVAAQGTVLSVNPFGAEQLGYTVEELIGQSVLNVFYPDDRQAVQRQLMACLEHPGQVAHWEFRKVRPDGSILWVREAARAVQGGDGRPVVLVVCEDITERRRAEEALRESEERYRLIAENTADTISVFDLNLKPMYVSPSVLKLRGYTVQEAMTQSLDQVLTPESLQKAKKVFAEQLALETSGKADPARTALLELEQYRKDGSMIWVELAASAIRDKDLQPTGILTVSRDITERKQTQEALTLFRSLIDHANDIIEVADPKTGRFLDVNERACLAHGYTREEYLALTVSQINPVVAGRSWKETVEELRRIGSFVRESQHRRKDGSTFPVEININYVRLDRDYVLSVVRDITARKKAEMELQRLKEFNESIVQNMAEGIAVEDAEGVFTFVNPAAAAMLGYTVDELTGQRWTAVIPPDQHPLVEAANQRRARGESDRYELELLRQDGERISALVSGGPRADGETRRFAGTLAVFTDITERVHAEQVLQQYTAQLEALRQVGLELIAELDLETLLHSIASQAVRILDCCSGGLCLYRPEREALELTTTVGPNMAPVGSLLRRGEGISGKAWQRGESLIVNDYQDWDEGADIAQGYPWAAVVAAPIRWGAEFLGVLSVVADAPQAFSQADAELLDLFAVQAAAAIRNARLYEAEQTRRRVADSLREVSGIVGSTLEPDQVLRLILEQLEKVLDFDAAALLLVDTARDELYVREWRGFPDQVARFRLSLRGEQGITVHVARSGQPIYVPDTSQDPHYVASGFEARSELAAPLEIKGRVIGVLNVESKPPHAYGEEDLQLLITFANQAAVAIENARLYDQERTSRERAEALQEAARVLGARLELDEILRRILEQLRRVLVYDTASVLILRKENQPDLVVGLGYADERMTSHEAGRLLQHSPILDRMAHDLEPVISPDVRELEGWIWVSGAENVRSWLAVPLVAHGQMIGTLMADKAQVGAFGQAEVEMAQALARHAAQAIENARLFEMEQGRTRELTEALERQKEMDRLQDEFIQNVSHELRTPLALVRGYAEMLDSGELGALNEDQCEPMAIIARRARALSALVEDFTAILELKTARMVPTPVDITQLLQEALADFRVQAEQKQITLRDEIPADAPPIMGQVYQLRKVVDNLMSNALKFTPDTGNVTISLTYDGQGLTVQVTDTGIGIPADKLDRIFERFYQVDGSASRRYGGTGLGLALAKEITKVHGGRITVESQVGQGSTFAVWLPLS